MTTAAPDPHRTVGGIDLQACTIDQLQAAMAAGLTCVELVGVYLARITEHDRRTCSVLATSPTALANAARLDRERAAGRLRGPLHGVPLLLKDNVGTADQPTTAGSVALAGLQPRADAHLVGKLRAAGAVVLGKTNLSEFANWVDPSMPNGWSGLGGQVRGAFTLADPSGSSSGSAVATALALAAATVGSETSGSILSPASVAGIVGVKPTRGLVSRTGVVPLAEGFDTAGPMTRTVRDAAVLLTVMAGSDPADPATLEADRHRVDYAAALAGATLDGARLGVSPRLRDDLEPAEKDVYDAALQLLRDRGAVVVETTALDDATALGLTLLGLIPAAFRIGLDAYLATAAPAPDSGVRSLADIVRFNEQHPSAVPHGQGLLVASVVFPGDAEAVAAASAALRAVQTRAIEEATADLDGLVAPGAAWSNLGASAGCPSVVVPAGLAGDIPLGLCFLGTPWSEVRLLRLAAAFEQAAPARPLPPLHPAL